jgi:hypothetical protein
MAFALQMVAKKTFWELEDSEECYESSTGSRRRALSQPPVRGLWAEAEAPEAEKFMADCDTTSEVSDTASTTASFGRLRCSSGDSVDSWAAMSEAEDESDRDLSPCSSASRRSAPPGVFAAPEAVFWVDASVFMASVGLDSNDSSNGQGPPGVFMASAKESTSAASSGPPGSFATEPSSPKGPPGVLIAPSSPGAGPPGVHTTPAVVPATPPGVLDARAASGPPGVFAADDAESQHSSA